MISPHFLAFMLKKMNLVRFQMFRSFLDNLLYILLYIYRRENGLPGEKYNIAAGLPKR